MKKKKKVLIFTGIIVVILLVFGLAVGINEKNDGSSLGFLSAIKDIFQKEPEFDPEALVASGTVEDEDVEEPYHEYDYSSLEGIEPLEPFEPNLSTETSSGDDEEEKELLIEDGNITCDAFGRFSGQYLEDGSDEPVENVAVILITNQSNEFLEFATLTFDIGGKGANFIVTGLPAGRSAWVMEAKRLVIGSGADFLYQDCVSTFRDDIVATTDKIDLTAKGNMLTATNVSEEALSDVVVYYRVLHTDGNYLSGVTYTANFGTLEPGASVETLAGHFSADNCKIVRISWQ